MRPFISYIALYFISIFINCEYLMFKYDYVILLILDEFKDILKAVIVDLTVHNIAVLPVVHHDEASFLYPRVSNFRNLHRRLLICVCGQFEDHQHNLLQIL